MSADRKSPRFGGVAQHAIGMSVEALSKHSDFRSDKTFNASLKCGRIDPVEDWRLKPHYGKVPPYLKQQQEAQAPQQDLGNSQGSLSPRSSPRASPRFTFTPRRENQKPYCTTYGLDRSFVPPTSFATRFAVTTAVAWKEEALLMSQTPQRWRAD